MLPARALRSGELPPRRFVQKYPDSSSRRAERHATGRRFIQKYPDSSLCRPRELNGYAAGVESVKSSFQFRREEMPQQHFRTENPTRLKVAT